MTFPLLLALLQSAAPPVVIAPRPARIYVERSAASQRLEFDFLIDGQTDDTVRLTSIRLTASDRTGKPWYIRAIDENGSDPSIRTVPRRTVPGRTSLLVFNPFSVFPPDVPLAKLDYQFTFALKGREWVVPVTVSPVEYRQPVELRIPVTGRILVFEGHDFYSHHRRFDYTHPILRQAGYKANSGRYAHDLSLVDDRGVMYRTDGKKNEDWLSWGVPIVAPAAGVVVEAENGMPDYDVGNPSAGLALDTILARPASLMGNHVVIDHGGGVFSRLFHMRKGSVRVRPGQRVTQGQVLGEIGFSGSVYTIHLHHEMAVGPAIDAEGLPAYFSRFRRVLGARKVPVTRGPIDTGDIVENP